MLEDLDPSETQEWRDALDSVLEFEGSDRAGFLLAELMAEARRNGAPVPYSANTPYLNTIPPQLEARHPGDQAIEHRIRSLIRWNAAAIVLRANKESSELGGHIASFQSAGTLYDVGFQHFWHAPSEGHGGDLVFFQGHSSPGFYARSFLEGRFSAGDDGLTVTFEGGKAPASAVFDKVLVAVGRRPSGRMIGAEYAGVRVDERGFIPVDKQQRTNVPHIFAIGDVVGQPMLAHKAVHEGKVAAEVAAGKNSYFDARVIPSVAYTDPEVAWVG
jgi:pyridine nucleotide-disulfide oxidoreductase